MAFTEIEYGWATVSLNRRHCRNARTRSTRGELIRAFDLADADEAVNVVQGFPVSVAQSAPDFAPFRPVNSREVP
jgi:1,4-dihydroxy-2-naphthoyl-CoA synthase